MVLKTQIERLDNPALVEVVISDNCSTDNTRQLIKENFNESYFKYSCNAQNLGANNNILKTGYELASGEYCWIIGDDDLIREGAIAYLLKVIEKGHNTDVIYINQSYEDASKRSEIVPQLPIEKSRVLCSYESDDMFDNGQFILRHVNLSALFTSVSSLIFKTTVWRDNFKGYLDFKQGKTFTSLYDTFPHSVILSKSIINSEVYYIGYPYLAFFIGAQEWLGDWSYLNFIRVLQLSELFEEHGASDDFLSKYRRFIFNASEEVYYELLSKKSHKFRKYLNNRLLIGKYISDENFRRLFKAVYKRLIKFHVKRLIKR